MREHKHGLAHSLKRFRFQTKEIKSIVRKQYELQQVQSTRQNSTYIRMFVFEHWTRVKDKAQPFSDFDILNNVKLQPGGGDPCVPDFE